ncbi:MAG: hypothetical protein E6356_00415 [Terrisporobacter othiniensis]|uniref:hypothetical protein n=1 Tax=Terrisporobacter petrolearius TaxID=1460447 RepID=UPI0008E923CD|nr:hypothetical protein [Terrisporobacter petrolearius]MBN9647397.1 hypothetical protein [Terrisporobacter glycolicus]MDU4860495.1 hypothetical protein [Terrisporobacter othiniensis]MDU6993276.1 hypothetical protein [Terrisporobacter othiniensis]SFJ34619.1 hypothetical protein SAMN02910355_2341 [Terrisporobacter glycolicus]
MKYLKIMYNAFLWALVFAITCFKSEWLEMRVNIGYILFIAFGVLTVIFSIYLRKKNLQFGFKFTIINIVICFIYGNFIYGFKRLQVVPASIIREGINITRVPFSKINLILLIILILGLLLILFSDRKEYKS